VLHIRIFILPFAGLQSTQVLVLKNIISIDISSSCTTCQETDIEGEIVAATLLYPNVIMRHETTENLRDERGWSQTVTRGVRSGQLVDGFLAGRC
jgi:hypothetical protein